MEENSKTIERLTELQEETFVKEIKWNRGYHDEGHKQKATMVIGNYDDSGTIVWSFNFENLHQITDSFQGTLRAMLRTDQENNGKKKTCSRKRKYSNIYSCTNFSLTDIYHLT